MGLLFLFTRRNVHRNDEGPSGIFGVWGMGRFTSIAIYGIVGFMMGDGILFLGLGGYFASLNRSSML